MTFLELPSHLTGSSKANTRVAYLGPVGTYSHEVTQMRFCGPEYTLEPYRSILEAVHALLPEQGQTRASWAVVPLENSYFGPVLETRQVLSEPIVIRHTLTLNERIRFKVQHCLVAHQAPQSSLLTSVESAAPIRKIYSHAQALGQCRQYIALHYPQAETVATPSTAEAATLVANDSSRSSLAICSPACIQYFPALIVLHFNIQDAGQENITTFIVLKSKD